MKESDIKSIINQFFNTKLDDSSTYKRQIGKMIKSLEEADPITVKRALISAIKSLLPEDILRRIEFENNIRTDINIEPEYIDIKNIDRKIEPKDIYKKHVAADGDGRE